MYFKGKNKIHNLSFITVHAATDRKDELEEEGFYQKIESIWWVVSNDIKVLIKVLKFQNQERRNLLRIGRKTAYM